MTRSELLQRIITAAGDALNNCEAFVEACNDLDKVGYERRISVHITLFPESEVEPLTVSEQSDADFLRSLRIEPDLEAK